jgi:hypothetical protein
LDFLDLAGRALPLAFLLLFPAPSAAECFFLHADSPPPPSTTVLAANTITVIHTTAERLDAHFATPAAERLDAHFATPATERLDAHFATRAVTGAAIRPNPARRSVPETMLCLIPITKYRKVRGNP